MRLPGAKHASIEPPKVRDYLLSGSHPIGRFKATFFRSLGYTAADSERLVADLHILIASNEADMGELTRYGQKYEVRGILQGPSGRTATVVSVWIVLAGQDIPRFVTAYPGESS